MKHYKAMAHLWKDMDVQIGEAWLGDDGIIHFDLHTVPLAVPHSKWTGRILLVPDKEEK